MGTENKRVCEMTVKEMKEEIERLKSSEYVKLMLKLEQRIYNLRSLERRGKKMAEAYEECKKNG